MLVLLAVGAWAAHRRDPLPPVAPRSPGVFVLPWVTNTRYVLGSPSLTIHRYFEAWDLPIDGWLAADPPTWDWPA